MKFNNIEDEVEYKVVMSKILVSVVRFYLFILNMLIFNRFFNENLESHSISWRIEALTLISHDFINET